MSDRLISADKAKEVLKHLLYETAMNNELDIADIYEDIIENRLDTWIELIPTADAVKHGHWNEAKDGTLWCSVCISDAPYVEDSWGYVIHAPHYDYCPNCGAIMDEAIDTPTDPVAK